MELNMIEDDIIEDDGIGYIELDEPHTSEDDEIKYYMTKFDNEYGMYANYSYSIVEDNIEVDINVCGTNEVLYIDIMTESKKIHQMIWQKSYSIFIMYDSISMYLADMSVTNKFENSMDDAIIRMCDRDFLEELCKRTICKSSRCV